tara:strand:- start:1319 stop:1654 length:336 start_codon:yes stop_codon:yes gene_type:complete
MLSVLIIIFLSYLLINNFINSTVEGVCSDKDCDNLDLIKTKENSSVLKKKIADAKKDFVKKIDELTKSFDNLVKPKTNKNTKLIDRNITDLDKMKDELGWDKSVDGNWPRD